MTIVWRLMLFTVELGRDQTWNIRKENLVCNNNKRFYRYFIICVLAISFKYS